jgi:modulator of FtsH protease
MAFSNSSLTERLTQNMAIDAERTSMIRKTYWLLSLAVVGMMVGGKVGSSSSAVLSLFSGWVGWIVAMVALNAVPIIAMKFRYNPTVGTLALFADGFIAGLVISPMLYVAQRFAGPGVIESAAWITFAIFAFVTATVHFTKTNWSPSRTLVSGLFFTIIGAVILNFFFQTTFLVLLISIAIGAFGIITLVSATSEVLQDPDIDTPVPGALSLFAGIFLVFQSALSLLMAFTGGGDD